MTKEENKEDSYKLIYDLPECFMMTCEELIDRTSTTIVGYDIWNEIPKQENNQTSTNVGRHFKPQENSQAPTNRERNFKPQVNGQILTNGGRHFKPRAANPNDSTKIAHITKGGRHLKSPYLETNNLVEALNRST